MPSFFINIYLSNMDVAIGVFFYFEYIDIINYEIYIERGH